MAATLVQSSGARSGNGTSQSWTWATAPTVGNVIIVKAVGWASPTGPTASCADAASNSYTQRTNELSTGSGATTTRAAIFDCVIASSPSSTTVTWSVSSDHSVVFEEWAGLDTASLSDQVATPALSGLISGSGSRTLTVGPTGTLAQANELVQTLLGAATGLAASNIATPSGYTGGVFEQNSPSFIGMGSAYKTVAATTAVDATWPFDVAGVAGQTAVALLATYRIAATLHATSGALSSQAASITGAAQHQHVTTGALSAQNAQINGAAVHATLHATTGALTAQPAVVTGAAAHEHAVTGALSAQAASVAGSSDHVIPGTTHDTTGALAAQNAALSGAADHLTLHATTGSLAAQSAAVSGVAVHPHVGSGALVAQGSVLAGTAAHEHAALGALSAQAAALTGDAETIAPGGPHLTTGALTAQVAVVSGAAQHTSANGEDLTDAKFQGPSHNTRIRWLRKCEEEATEPQLPEPATEEPQPVAPKAPPRSTGLGEIAPPPVASVAVPEIRVPELKVVPPAKAAAPAPAPVEAAPAAVVGTASAAPVTVPAPAGPPPVVAQDLAKLEREMTAFVEGVVAGLTKQVAALDKMLQAKASELAAAQREIADLKRREVNRQRAEALARKIAEDDE